MKAALKSHKKILVIAGAVLILLISLGILSYNVACSEMELIHSSMTSTMSTFENKYKRAESLQEISAIIDGEVVEGSLYLIGTTFREADDVQTALDTLERDYLDVYLIDPSGKWYAAKGAAELPLSEDQLGMLLGSGTLTYETDGDIAYYSSLEMPEGTLITCYKKSMELGDNSTLTGISNRYDYFIAPMSDGIINESTNEALLGTHIPERLEKSPLGTDNNLKSLIDGYNYGFADLGIGKAYCLTYETDGYLFGLYYRYIDILWDIINEMITPTVVLGGSFAVILIFFFALWKSSDEKDRKWIRFFRTHSYFEQSQVKHLSCFVLLTLVISLLFNTHFFEFSSYSMQNVLSTQNLDMLAENIKASEKDKKIVVGIVENYVHGMAEQLSGLIAMNADICSHEQLKEIADNCFLNEISVFDEDGKLVASSGKYSKYELTQNEDNPLYAVRSLYTDDPEYVFVDYDDGSGRYAIAQRREDDAGIILIKYQNPDLTRMLAYYSKDEAIKGTDFGNATTFFVKLDEGNSTYVVEPYSTQASSTEVTVPEELEQDNYSGIATIDGTESYVNTRKSGGIAIVSAIDVRILDGMLYSDLIVVLLGFVLLMAVLFIGCLCQPEICDAEAEEAAPESAAVTDRNKASLFADTCFRRMIKYEFIVLIIAYCLMMFKGTVGGQTIFEFIFGGKWDKGFNLFSINASIIVGVAVVVLMFLIKKLLLFVGNSIGNKGLTICSIAVSLIQFVGLFYIVLHTLYQFGVNTTALIASAGIAGLVIGIATKDIIGDLIAGLFLIFEGNIRVGDFIKFKDFRGEVSEIGARVSVIKRYNSKLIVNNSDFRQYYRLSDELGSAWVEINVGANEDIDRIRKLIDDSSEWYQSRIPTLKGGPWFLNISNFDSSGVTVCLCGSCTEERSGSTRRKLLLCTMELFRENGITLAQDSIRVLPPETDE